MTAAPKSDEELVREAARCLGPLSRHARVVRDADALRAAGHNVVIRCRPARVEVADDAC
jgi:hypothetical protein